METEELAARLGALGNETRLGIFRLLVRAGEHGMPVGELQQHTGIPLSTLSHHLRKLVTVGLVHQRREGTTLHCCADFHAMNQTLGFLRIECCADAGAQASEAAMAAVQS